MNSSDDPATDSAASSVLAKNLTNEDDSKTPNVVETPVCRISLVVAVNLALYDFDIITISKSCSFYFIRFCILYIAGWCIWAVVRPGPSAKRG